MKYSNFSVVFLVLIGFGCKSEYDLQNFQKSNHTYFELPDTVRTKFKQLTGPELILFANGDSLYLNSARDTIICLNNSSSICDYHIVFRETFVDRIVFTINKTTLFSYYQYNKFNPPYILYDNRLYFVESKNVWTQKKLEQAIFGSYDLSSIKNLE